MINKAKNKYYNRSHISKHKFKQLIKCFSMDLNAYEASQITNTSHVSCKKIFHKLRIYVITYLLKSDISQSEFELDESYFGARRIKR